MAELLTKRGLPEAVFMVRLVLWLLSTRLGTFLLCGSLCFGEKWPYFKNFSSIPLDKRERVLQKWFKHRFFTPIRTAFVYVKILVLYVFFSRVMPSDHFSGFHVLYSLVFSSILIMPDSFLFFVFFIIWAVEVQGWLTWVRNYKGD
jgi:hypothetical protein